MSDYLTDTELAEILDMKPTSVRRMIRRGDLPGREIKQGKTLTLKSDFNDWLQEDIPKPIEVNETNEPEPITQPKQPTPSTPMACEPSTHTYYLRRKQNQPNAK